jgi:hypothetical protein
MPEHYEEIRVMFEEERERRRALQQELETLVEECELARQQQSHHEHEAQEKAQHVVEPGAPQQSGERPRGSASKRLGLSLEVDLALRALRQELGYQEPRRRATIGKCAFFSGPSRLQRARQAGAEASLLGSDSPPGGPPLGKNKQQVTPGPSRLGTVRFDLSPEARARAASEQSRNAGFPATAYGGACRAHDLGEAETAQAHGTTGGVEEGAEEASPSSSAVALEPHHRALSPVDSLATYVRTPPPRVRRIRVQAAQGDGERHMSYIVSADKPRGGWRMVQTRYRHFGKIYAWLKQHHQGGLLECEPTEVPMDRGGLFKRGGSLERHNVRRRRVWLEHNLMAVQQQVPALLDVLLDFISLLGGRA